MSCDSNVNEDSGYIDLKSFVAAITTLLILFVIGLYLQIKIMRGLIRNKGVNWKVDIYHSIMMIGFFSFRICFEMVTYFIPTLHQYTGNWFCYITLFINQFGIASIFSHSLIIAIYKYIYVMHNPLIHFIGENKANLISVWISIILPALFAISFTARPSTMLSYSSILNCLGMKAETDTQTHKPWRQKLQTFFTCGFDDVTYHDRNELSNQIINFVTIAGCTLTSILLAIIILNVFEVFCYYRLFAFAKR